MLKFSDLSVGDYVLWAKQKSNVEGDYDLEFEIKQLNLGHFVFMEENVWNEDDLNEFVKPIEITHELMNKLGFSKEETWAGIVQYSYVNEVKDGIEYHGMKFNLHECVHVTMDSNNDIVKNIIIDCFNKAGAFHIERVKASGIHYLHELQHAMRECGIEKEIKI